MDAFFYLLAFVAGVVAMRLLLWRRWRDWKTANVQLESDFVEFSEQEIDLREREVDLEKQVDTAERFAWSVKRRFDQSTPGPDDDPVLYILPDGIERTNSCEEARRAWMDAAVEAGFPYEVKPHPKLVETFKKKKEEKERREREARSG